jgi:2-methylisocitrate lyase-like PEP mutase family enzyme
MADDFRSLHRSGCFVVPNPWDVGAAVVLEELGFKALATTSSGFAMSMGRPDQTVTREELVGHVATMSTRVSIPITVDSEECYPADPGGIAETIRLLADAGAAGCSIEDWDQDRPRIRPLDEALDAVATAVGAASERGLVLTARAENHIRGVDDLEDTIARLVAYRDAGADVLYAPGLSDLDLIRRVVAEVGAPINVLLLPNGPTVDELAAAGVRRISTGGRLARMAYNSLRETAQVVLDGGNPGK